MPRTTAWAPLRWATAAAVVSLCAASVDRREACRASVDAAWAPAPAAGPERRLIHHKNRCFEDRDPASRRSLAPRACPAVTVDGAARCLARANVSGVVFVGDSISGQLWGSPLCANATDRGFGLPPGAVRFDDRGTFSVSRAVVGAGDARLAWSYLRVHGPQTADRFSRALRAGGRGLFPDPALFVVNAGLWHLFPQDGLADYEARVDDLLAAVLSVAAPGSRVDWRQTTAVHRELFPRKMKDKDRRKFERFDNDHVRALNAAAAKICLRRAGVALRPHAFAATLVRADGHMRGDARHYGAGVLQSLLALLFIEACDYGDPPTPD